MGRSWCIALRIRLEVFAVDGCFLIGNDLIHKVGQSMF